MLLCVSGEEGSVKTDVSRQFCESFVIIVFSKSSNYFSTEWLLFHFLSASLQC